MLEVCFVYMENSYKTSVWLDQSWQQQKIIIKSLNSNWMKQLCEFFPPTSVQKKGITCILLHYRPCLNVK